MSQLSTMLPALPFLKARSRGMGRRIAAAPGAGKTRIAARLLILFDLFARYPIICLDPNGALSQDVLDAIDRLPTWLRKKLDSRLLYLNVGGQRIGTKTYVHTFPFLYTSESGKETLYTKAHRFLSVLAKTDPAQAKAPIMGRSAIEDIGEKVLMALFALGWQITEAPALIEDPMRFRAQLLAAKEREPEAAPAIDYLLGEYAKLAPREKEMKTSQFLRKISPFILDPVLRAIYGASEPSITPAEVVTKRLCVLLDFRDVPKSQRSLAIVWAYTYWDEYFRERGPNKQHIPICFYIDELSFVIPSGEERHTLIADDVAELLSVTARNNQIFVTVIHQDLQQFDKKTNELLSRLGTQILIDMAKNTTLVFGAIGAFMDLLSGDTSVEQYVEKITSFSGSMGDATRASIAFAIGVGASIRDVLATVTSIGTRMYSAGRSLIQNLINGMTSVLGGVGDAIGGVMSLIEDYLPHSPAKRGPFSGSGWAAVKNAGLAIGDQFGSGLTDSQPGFNAELGSLVSASSLTARVDASVYGSSAGAAGAVPQKSATVNVYPTPGMSEESIGRVAVNSLNFELRSA